MGIADHTAIEPDAVGCDVDKIPVADGHIAVKAHLFGPEVENLRPL
ncbi:hypothetical protein [Neptunicoccus cionae]|nr:hypothetical protein [Amylibacter cionae]